MDGSETEQMQVAAIQEHLGNILVADKNDAEYTAMVSNAVKDLVSQPLASMPPGQTSKTIYRKCQMEGALAGLA